MDNQIDEKSVLQYLIQSGKIDLHNIQKDMEEEKRREILQQHKYSIYQGSDGRWRTTIPDETKKQGRRLIVKHDKKSLDDFLIAYYNKEETPPKKPKKKKKDVDEIVNIHPKITLEELYPIWLKSRMLEVNNVRTVKKNDQDWKRYYLGTKITKVPMAELSPNKLKDWAHEMIEKHDLDKRAYYNMTVIMKKCYEYLADEDVCENIWGRVRINTKKFRKRQKPENSTQIFFQDEKERIIRKSLENFAMRPWNIGILSIPLLFVTGMRVGEVVALKYDDVGSKTISVRREEVGDFVYNDELQKFQYVGKKVEDHAKTDAGIREIPLTESARKIIDLVRESSRYYGYHDDGFIFCPAGKRMTSNSVDCNLYRYCDELGIDRKSAHKIRKTYISKLFASGIDVDTVCRVSGHVDAKTTFDSYLFSLDRKEDTYEKFESIFNEKNALILM